MQVIYLDEGHTYNDPPTPTRGQARNKLAPFGELKAGSSSEAKRQFQKYEFGSCTQAPTYSRRGELCHFFQVNSGPIDILLHHTFGLMIPLWMHHLPAAAGACASTIPCSVEKRLAKTRRRPVRFPSHSHRIQCNTPRRLFSIMPVPRRNLIGSVLLGLKFPMW